VADTSGETMKRRNVAVAAGTIAGFVFLLAIGGLVFISMGAYNVAATTPHTPFIHWLLKTTQERSVVVRADEVSAQPPMDSAVLGHGFEEYHEMCAACHGAPGMERGPLGKGINPEPPDLAKEVGEWSDRELFWITKHGIKMAGMPAFGVTHSDEELWGIVAFLRQLPSISPEEYMRLATEAQTHVQAGALEIAPQGHAGMQETDHDRTGHSPTAGPIRRTGAQAPSRGGMPGMDHDRMPGRRGNAERPGAEPAHVDAEATEKVKALVVELLRDSVVLERIRADSALRRRWANDSVRRPLAKPPR
jgi:mono/diheme cytochrome c family protein